MLKIEKERSRQWSKFRAKPLGQLLVLKKRLGVIFDSFIAETIKLVHFTVDMY